MSTYSASGERILQVADPKLLESVDCSKSIKYLHNMISVRVRFTLACLRAQARARGKI